MSDAPSSKKRNRNINAPEAENAFRLVGALDINIVLAFVFGVSFLITMLVLATEFTNPTPFQIQVFMTTLSLAAAGVGAVLPGRIEFRYKNLLRATGAAAFFGIVWFTQPLIESKVVRLEKPSQSADIVIGTFFRDLEAGNVSASYNQLDQIVRDQISLARWQQLYDANVKGLGKLQRRKFMGFNAFESPPGYPVGLYEQYQYLTKYQEVPGCRPETLVVRATQDKQWRVYSYLIGHATVDCGPSFNSN